MALASNRKQRTKQAQAHASTPNSPSSQLLETVSPFQEFTGYHLYQRPTRQSSNSGGGGQSKKNRRSMASDQLASLKAKHLLFYQEQLQQLASTAVQQHPNKATAAAVAATDIPSEIVTVNETSGTTNHVPGTIVVPETDPDEYSVVSLDHAWEEEEAMYRQYHQHQFQLSAPPVTAALAFPPLSKHHTARHDTTWGITTTRLDDDDDGDDTPDDTTTVSEIDWPSDEDERVAPTTGALCHLFPQIQNCSALSFWTQGAAHQQNLHRKRSTGFVHAGGSSQRCSNVMIAPRLAVAAARDEENTSDRGSSAAANHIREDGVPLEPDWSAYEEFPTSLSRDQLQSKTLVYL